MNHSKNLILLVLKVLLPFALAHLLSYLFRTVNAVVYPELSSELHLAANDIGLLTSSYLIMFAIAQLPIGVALDHFGPRKVQVPMLLIAASGAILFSFAHTLSELVVARGLIGLGVAASLMAAIKGTSLWFSHDRLPLVTAVLLSVGGIGAMLSTSPMHIAMDYVGWRNAFLGLGVATIMVSALIFFVVPEKDQNKQSTSFKQMAGMVKQLYSSWSFWKISLYSIFANAAFMSVMGLWMGPWLKDVAHLNTTQASYALLMGAVAMFAGSLSFGWITNALQKQGFKPLLICGVGIWGFVIAQLLMISNLEIPPFVIVIGFAFFGTAATMNYAIVAQSVPKHLTGRVSTSFNLLIFLIAFVLQWAQGYIINLWQAVNGEYPEVAYQYAIGLTILLQIPGLLLWFTLKPWEKA